MLEAPSADPIERRTIRWLAGVFLLCFLYFLPSLGDWNSNSRLDLTLALADRHTAQIDHYRWNTGDFAEYRGHAYIDKAPGMSFLGVPVYLAIKTALAAVPSVHLSTRIAQRTDEGRFYYLVVLYLVSAVTVVLPAVFLLLLFFWFLGFYSDSVQNRVILTLGLGLGTMLFPYSRVFYAHVPAAALLFAAFVTAYMASASPLPARNPARWLQQHGGASASIVGLALGLAVLIDHTSVVIGCLVGPYALVRIHPRYWICLLLAALPAGVSVLAYNHAAFHSALTTGYSTSGAGIGGSDSSWPPHGAAIWGMTFSPYRGLFFLSPFLLLAIPGYVLWARLRRWEWLLSAGISVVFFWFITLHRYWPAGSAIGPRYLVPILPFLALPIIFVLDRCSARMKFAVYALFGLSALNAWLQLAAAARGYPPVNVANPLFSYSLPALAHGQATMSLGSIAVGPFVGIHSPLTLVPLAALLLWRWKCRPRHEQAVPGGVAVAASA